MTMQGSQEGSLSSYHPYLCEKSDATNPLYVNILHFQNVICCWDSRSCCLFSGPVCFRWFSVLSSKLASLIHLKDFVIMRGHFLAFWHVSEYVPHRKHISFQAITSSAFSSPVWLYLCKASYPRASRSRNLVWQNLERKE